MVAAGRVLAASAAADERGARSDLFRSVRTALRAASVDAREISRVVVGTGPGSFTGMRVALGIAWGFRLADPAVTLAGVDAPTILAHAAGARRPVLVAIPWGRVRVLLARASAGGSTALGRGLVGRDELPRMRELAGRRVVLAPGAGDLAWPTGVELLPGRMSPLEALASIAARRGAATARPRPTYLVAPDAALPARHARSFPGWELAELGPADLDQLLEIERASFSAPWSRAMLAQELESAEPGRALGLRAPGGRLEAAALARVDADLFSIMSVAVRPSTRRRGLGRALVRELIARARQAGCSRVDLEVRVNNTAAITLYATEGFVPVGMRRRYYSDGTDALLMSLVLRR
ncbi:MAG: ribosomal protein S18-alanine N-acetyltransferase [Acidobacteria bacterium]|nr:ribosomal protein S18-alanine N-acetyltransferase [Acidobacteriota bacterium]